MFPQTLLLDIPPGSMGTLKTKFVFYYIYYLMMKMILQLLLHCPQSYYCSKHSNT